MERQRRKRMYSQSPDQVIRAALHHAIDERESLADAYRAQFPNQVVDKEAAAKIEIAMEQAADFRLMLDRRYNESH